MLIVVTIDQFDWKSEFCIIKYTIVYRFA